ncbi:MAG: hypothetical protein A2Y40_07540 [Candidatus Margulisbacteria bacterium GWF2_35_9]|nr:MAG: hypothetical protein A2Y40_07540 [Candidatus Margulisbacteria bacterium GWF2_35_9]
MNPLDKIKKIQEDAKKRVSEEKLTFPIRIFVGNATCENAAGAESVYNELVKIKDEQKLDQLYIGQTGCSGRCDKEPIVQVFVENRIPTKYCEMTPEKIQKVITDHILNKKIIKEWTL